MTHIPLRVHPVFHAIAILKDQSINYVRGMLESVNVKPVSGKLKLDPNA